MLTEKQRNYLLKGVEEERKEGHTPFHSYPHYETATCIAEYTKERDEELKQSMEAALSDLAALWEVYFEESPLAALAIVEEKRKAAQEKARLKELEALDFAVAEFAAE